MGIGAIALLKDVPSLSTRAASLARISRMFDDNGPKTSYPV